MKNSWALNHMQVPQRLILKSEYFTYELAGPGSLQVYEEYFIGILYDYC